MRFSELLVEAIVSPDNDMISIVSQILDDINQDYQAYLDDNNDVDDIDYLAELLNEEFEEEGLPIQVLVDPNEIQNPHEYISAQASWAGDEEKGIDIILRAANLTGKWGPKTFKKVFINAMKHETIHFGQYDRIGKEKLGKIKSGHQRGQEKLAKGGTREDWLRDYLADPHEIMAYGNDLAGEIKDEPEAEQAEILRSPEGHMKRLPTYEKYRQLFDKDSKEIKQLLRYTAQYMQRD